MSKFEKKQRSFYQYIGFFALLAVLGLYGNNIMLKWQMGNTKLNQAKYNFEMEEFYRLVGKHLQEELDLEEKRGKESL